MNLGGIGRSSTTTAQGQPELLKAATDTVQQVAKRASTANQIKLKLKIKMKGGKDAG